MWLPRGLKLDQFVTVDESKWLVRSANFYEALANDHFQHTFQHGHPGVTIMWAGTLGYVLTFPDYPQVTPGQFNWTDYQFDDFLAAQGYSSLQMLAIGRSLIVLMAALALGVAFLMALRLLGWLPSIIGFGLIVLDPFQIGLARVMHPDSLLSVFMFLSGLAYLSYLFTGRRRRDLVLSAVAAALTLLTKTPGIFLLPLVGLFAIIETFYFVMGQSGWQWRDFVRMHTIGRALLPLAAWVLIAVGVYVLLWPALWVAPRATLAEVMDISGDYAEQGHSSPIFFAGQIFNGDPGTWFYPITWLWRTTPIVMAGLLLTVVAFVLRWAIVKPSRVKFTALGVFLWAVFFVVFMNLGAKKFDRYLLPVYMPLDLLAGIGWAAAVYRLHTARAVWIARYAAPGLAVIVLVAQGAFTLPTYPYYLSYYNPVMGGSKRAPDVMFIGWGQGLDQAARYLNETIDTDTASVASWYPRGPFSFFYKGVTDSNRGTWESDYSVIYAHQWQRELPSRRMMHYFNSLTPEQSFTINNIEYARVYDMREAPLADYTVDFGDAIRLVYYDTFSGAMHPGQKWDMTMYFVKQAPIDKSLNILVRLVNQEGDEILRIDGWPDGESTKGLDIGELLRDNSYELEITEDTPPGLYRIEVSFYDPATLDHLPVTSANTGETLPDPYLLDYLIIGDLPQEPTRPLDPPADLGGQVALLGADLLDGESNPIRRNPPAYRPGDTVDLRLFWRALAYMYTDYTAFVHVLGPDGQVVAQHDQRPMNGFLPTSYWPPNQVIADDYAIEIPADAPPGDYQVLVGLYDLETMDRLPVYARWRTQRRRRGGAHLCGAVATQ